MEAKLIKLDRDKYTLIYKEGNIVVEHNPELDGKISLKNCQAIENGYDLDELFESIPIGPTDKNGRWKLRAGFITGFQKAVEILGDKKFSEDDMINSYNKGASVRYSRIGEAILKSEFIQSLQQTEFDVEVVMEYQGFEEDGKLKEAYVPKLDADGCLILRHK